MPTCAGKVEIEYGTNPGPPPTVYVAKVFIVGSRFGEGTFEFDPCPALWADAFEKAAGKRATVTYSEGPPVTITGLRVG